MYVDLWAIFDLLSVFSILWIVGLFCYGLLNAARDLYRKVTK